MAITFIQQKKRQKYLIIALAVLIAISFLVVWRMFLVKPESISEPKILKKPEVKINFDTLKNPIFDKLTPFEPIPSFSEEIGRDNPFSSY